MIRMKHDKHGFCYSHNANEETYLRNLGWVPEDEVVGAPSNETVPHTEPAAMFDPPKRRGRPPKAK